MTVSLSTPERFALADRLRSHEDAVAVQVTDEFFGRHPDWLARYGGRGRRLGIEDALFHISFLAGAIESGGRASFEDYARWVARMLAARGITPSFVAENLVQIDSAFRPLLSPDQHTFAGSFISAACAACTEPATSSLNGTGATALETAQVLYLQAILGGQRKAATNIALDALSEAGSVLDVYEGVFQHSQYEVGRLWEANKISVAQEHLATAVTQFVLAQVYAHLETSDVQRGRMLITGVQGELHQVGANMVADVLESEGWEMRFLGTNIPHAGILDALEEHGADVLGISATVLSSLPQVRELIGVVRAKFGSGIRIVLGGAAFRFAPSACEDLGADDSAFDLHSAVKLLCDDRKKRTGSSSADRPVFRREGWW